MPFKDFTAGEVLTAADVDNFLMRQTVMVFDDASARDTALSAVLAEGMVAYTKDDDVIRSYSGSVWSPIGRTRFFPKVRKVRILFRTERRESSTRIQLVHCYC